MNLRHLAERTVRAGSIALAVTSIASISPPAHAGASSANKAAADVLYDDAKRLMANGDFETACPKLVESQRLDPGVGTLLTLGECYDHTGRTASAWATFREAAALAATRGQQSREKTARKRAESLEPRLAKLVINVPRTNDLAGLTVQRDHDPIGRVLWGTPMPIDTGDHTIEATAPGRKPWTTTVHVTRDGDIANVTVPALPAADVAAAAPPPTVAAPTAPEAPRELFDSQRIAGIATGGTGLIGLGLGIGLGVAAQAKHTAAQAHCSPTCAAGGGDALQSDAKKLALGSTVSFVVGGTLLAGGALLVFLPPLWKTGSSTASVAPVVTRDVRGMVVGGAF